MVVELTSLWNSVLADLEKEVSAANFFTLLKNTALLSLENQTATIAAQSSIAINMLQKRFAQTIKESLDKHTESNIKIIFVPHIRTLTTSDQAGPLFAQEEAKKPFVGHLPRVRSDFTFENLAVSSSNQLAYVSAQTVAKSLGKNYNPLFIYGPVGVGKTHLMQAIANEVYRKDPTIKVIYITSEEFTNEVVDAIRTNQTQHMKRRFRTCRLLLIDDVQFIAGKDKVQEELFHTFNILIDNGAQVVLSSDRPPSEIKKLEKRLSSRFSGGLTVDIESPDFELKSAILLIKAQKYGFSLPIELAKKIAESVEDTRSLEGALLRIITEAQTRDGRITSAITSKVLGEEKEKNIRLHPDDVIKQICEFYAVKPTALKGPKRDAALVRARQITMYILLKELGLTLVEIGNVLGGRDHTTVMHGVRKIEESVNKMPEMGREIVGITKVLRE